MVRKLSWITFTLLVLTSIMVNPILTLDPEVEASIDALISQFLPANHIPGLGLAIFSGTESGNGNTMLRGYGFRNLEDRLATSPSTKFGIGSISKSFTAVLVVKVLSEKFPELGEHVLDVPIRELIPAINFTLSDRFRSESVSFRDLLAHRSCLFSDFLVSSAEPIQDKYEYLYRQRYAPEQCSFRTQLVYNNGHYVLASEYAALIAGTSLENLLEGLLADIGMSASTYFQKPIDYETVLDMSRAYYRNGTQTMQYNYELIKRVSILIGAGAVISSPNDMLNYIKFTLNKGKVGEKQIVSEAAMSWLGKSYMNFPFNSFKTNEGDESVGDFGYGLGYFIGIHDGWEKISHGGYIPPFLSLLSFYPALNIGIFTSINGPGRGPNLDALHANIFNILKAKGTLPKFIPFDNIKTRRPETQKITEISEFEKLPPTQVIGVYGNGLSGEFTVTELSEPGQYYLSYGEWAKGILHQITNTTFLIEWTTDIVQDEYTYGPIDEIPPTYLDFSVMDQITLITSDGSRVTFEKGLTLDKLPVQPWDPTSCGPNAPNFY